MYLELIIRYFHFIGIMVLVATLFGELLLISKKMNNEKFKTLVKLDGAFGASAAVVLIAGLLLWFVVGKPSEFYNLNGLFHIKVTLFLLVGILSIIPTVFFLKNRKSTESIIIVPAFVTRIIYAEVFLVALIPLFAVLMARGVGLNG